MKREKASLTSNLIRFQKMGGGSFRGTIQGRYRIIKPGEVFLARLDEIPEKFRDTIIPVDGENYKTVKEQIEAEKPVPVEYTLKHRGGGWFNVLDKNGKQVNEKALKREAAKELISSLT